ncbi:MAG: PAS domain S-box protein [Bacteroidota bacterium]
MNSDLKILLVEDNPIDVRLIREFLKKSSYGNATLFDVKCIQDALIYSKEEILVLLLDLGLPDSYGSETVRLIREHFPDSAIIVLTGLDDDTVVAESLRLGAQNYLTKNQIDSKVLDKTIRFAMERNVFVRKLKKIDNELIHANRLYAFISQINQTIVHSQNEQTVFKKACKIAIEYGKFKSAWIGLFDHINKKINLIEEFGLMHQDIVLFTNTPYDKKGPQEHVLRTDTYFVCNNIQSDLELSSWKPISATRDWNSCMVLPLRKSGKIIGTLNLYSDEIDFFNKKEIALLMEAAGDISFALDIFEKDKQRIHTEQRLKQSEFRYREFFETAPEVIIVMDAETGSFIDYNNNALKLFKLSGVQFLKKSPSEVSPPMQPDGKTSAEKATEMIQSAMHGENPIFDWVVRDSEGKDIFCEVRLTLFTNPDRKLIRCNLFEITARKKAEQILLQSQLNLQAIFEHTLEGFILTDAQGVLKVFNSTAFDLIFLNTGHEIKAGKSIYEFMHDSKKENYRNIISKVLAGETVEYDHSYQRTNGEVKWFNWTKNPVYKDGKVDGICITIRDITRHKEADQALLNSRSNFSAIIENTDASIYSLDRDYRYVTFNKLLHDTLKQVYDLDIKPGDNVYSFLDKLNPSEAKEWREVYSKALRGESVKFEKEFHIDDFYNCSSFSIHPIWEMEEVIGLSCFAFDITKQKQGELQKEKMTADIIQRNKNLEQFSYIVSHNLRAPIANIIGFSDLLKSGDHGAETIAEINEGLSTSVRKLDDVIKDLNHILHIKGNVSEEKEPVNFTQLATDIYISIETLIAKEEAIIAWDFTKVNEMLTIKSYLYSIFTNLITNSIKYRQPNIPPAIKIRSFNLDHKTILTFTDNGMGIDLEKKGDQVFGLYKRFHTNRAEGKGMGLFMVKTQVETIGGTIRISSEVNKGTEFRIEFTNIVNHE